jgi:hypothetical protein
MKSQVGSLASRINTKQKEDWNWKLERHQENGNTMAYKRMRCHLSSEVPRGQQWGQNNQKTYFFLFIYCIFTIYSHFILDKRVAI